MASSSRRRSNQGLRNGVPRTAAGAVGRIPVASQVVRDEMFKAKFNERCADVSEVRLGTALSGRNLDDAQMRKAAKRRDG